jgi:hypothetical protein
MTSWAAELLLFELALTILSTVLAIKIRFIPASIAAGLFWIGLFFALTTDPTMANWMNLTYTAPKFFLGGIVLWIAIPWLLQLRNDVTVEKRARGIRGLGGVLNDSAATQLKHSWSWNKSSPTTNERQAAYRERLRSKRR